MLFFCIPHLSTWATELWRWFTMRPIDTKRLCGPRRARPTAAPPHLAGVQGGPTSWWHRGGWGSTWKVDKLSRWIRWMLRAQVFRMAPLVKSPRTGNYTTNMSLFDIFIGKSTMKSPFFHRSIHRCKTPRIAFAPPRRRGSPWRRRSAISRSSSRQPRCGGLGGFTKKKLPRDDISNVSNVWNMLMDNNG